MTRSMFRLKGPTRVIVPAAVILLAVGVFRIAPAPAQSAAPATFADVASQASPAVVNISTEKTIKAGDAFQVPGPRGRQGQDPFQDFLERYFGGQGGPMGERKEHSLGSGFLISSDGLIITNNHVVDGANEIIVRMSNEKEYHVEVLGRDAKTDLALLKVKAAGPFPFLKTGDSSKLRIGDWVVAIGNPFGLEHTVTAGILSARGRAIGAGPYDDFLQTDASINPGNSGGPLLNLAGEVIGINTAIVAGGQGIGFAIPVNMAANIIDQLRHKGRVVRGWLGVMIQKVTPELAKSFKLDKENGALVGDVVPGGPAEKAGVKRGDVIVKFDGKDIGQWSDLPVMVAQTPVGRETEIQVVRDGDEKNLSVTVGELKDEETPGVAAAGGNLGITAQELTPELAEGLGLSETKGVVISGITDGSPAADSGLKPGDVILEMNRTVIKGLDDYRKIESGVRKGDTVLFLIRRGSNTLFFTMEAQ
ncbi:MAG: DegQ family serine endoprotease [Pseudomonadota bacterium]